MFFQVVLITILIISWILKNFFKHKHLESKYRERNVLYKPLGSVVVNFLLNKRNELQLYNVIQKCGQKIFGINVFDESVTIVVAIPELVQTVLSKEFTNFINRRKTKLNDKIFSKILFFSEDETWKRIRSIVSTAFSAKKLRQMLPQIHETTKTLMKNFDQTIKQEDAIDIKKLVGAFTMDTIVKTAFGVQIDSLTDLDNPLVNSARKIFSPNTNLWQTFQFIFFLYFPFLRNLRMRFFIPGSSRVLYEYSKIVIKEKREKFAQKNVKALDFIELMLEAEIDGHKTYYDENNQMDGDSQKINKYITEDEMISQCMLFFFAGYDTTATTLTMSCYNLATNPDKQEKLYEEIISIFQELATENNQQGIEKDKLLTVETLSKFKYLEAVINETLRLYPVVTFIERRAVSDMRLETSDGKHRIELKEGDVILIPIYSLHHDLEEWEDPFKFKPERFLNEPRYHKYSYIPFGSGPRICVGRLLGLMETKIALMNIVLRYKLRVCPQTSVPPKFSNRTGLLAPYKIQLKVERR